MRFGTPLAIYEGQIMMTIMHNIKIYAAFAAFMASASPLMAQQSWTADDCMRYAVHHNHDVRQAEITADSYRASRTAAIGSFLPTVSVATNAQLNSGRTIDNETNTYGDYSQFYNGYSLQADLPLFDGCATINRLRAANSNRRMGESAIARTQDQAAIDVLQAYADAVFYEGLAQVSRQKLAASDSTHLQTVRQVELGLKSDADAAQTAQQVAADAYDLSHNEGLAQTSLLKLRQLMNLPDSVELVLALPAAVDAVPATPDAAQVFDAARVSNPSVAEARHAQESANFSRKAAIGDAMPSLSIQAGIGTYYYKYLNSDASATAEFHDQMKGNRSQYVQARLVIPIFNGLQSSTSIRKARNEMRSAQEKYLQSLDNLRNEALMATTDCRQAFADLSQSDAKVIADSIAYHVARRQYEEGLTDPLELKTAANSLALSRAQNLQCRLTLFLKQRYLNYLMGNPMINE